jgi:hypothetical protein
MAVLSCCTEIMNIPQLLRGLAERVSASAWVKNAYGDPVVDGCPPAPAARSFTSDGTRFIHFDERQKMGPPWHLAIFF